MGSVEVIRRSRFSRNFKAKLAVFLIYFIAAAAFGIITFRPAESPEAVYASESAAAEESLSIPSISLETPVVEVSVDGADLEVPSQIAGAYSKNPGKTLLIGHSSTVFKNLKYLTLGSSVIYNGEKYTVTHIVEKAKSDIEMKDVLRGAKVETLVLMTCSGEPLPGTTSDYSHRLIITAEISDLGE